MAISTWKSVIWAARPKIADWLGQPDPDTVSSNVGGFADTALPAAVPPARHPALTTLASFGGPDGSRPEAGLIFDAAGDIFGTTAYGGPDGEGTVFEIAKTGGGYASAPMTLVSFTGANGKTPLGGLISDAAGDLFGTTEFKGGGEGTVFEIVKNGDGYAGAPTTLATFSGADGKWPVGGLITDQAGDLFGVTYDGGANGDGTVFEIAKIPGGYANTPTTLASFDYADGNHPLGDLIADANGDLFGTTVGGGPDGSLGTVYEIAKTPSGYASTPTTLVSFTGPDGLTPYAGLIADAAGDLFGTTDNGGADRYGTVFEIVKTADGYASAPTILVSFTSADGANPYGGLIIDAAGDLFGTTNSGGTNLRGTVFEIVKTQDGYASAPTTLVNFTGPDGNSPEGALIADAAGNLYGTTKYGGKHNEGTVFEITHSGFVVSPPPAVFVQAMASHGAGASGSTSLAGLTTTHETPTLILTPRVG
jgi:uncharacterized repeat protein (TIGR03803 family)